MVNINDLKREILELADIIAAATLKHIKPVADEISKSEAQREFGYRWINNYVQRGSLKQHRNGPHKNSPIVFSRTECLALKEAERRGAYIIRKKINKQL